MPSATEIAKLLQSLAFIYYISITSVSKVSAKKMYENSCCTLQIIIKNVLVMCVYCFKRI